MARRKRQKKSQKVSLLSQVNWANVGRWLVAMVLFAMMGSAAAWGVMKLRDPKVLPVKVVRIDGDFKHLKRVDLERAVGDRVDGNFFTIDVTAVRNAALSLPWVDQVSVRRVWPDTLMMWVDEQVPLARWGKTGLVNARGDLFEPDTGSIPEGLPRLDGPDDSSVAVVRRYQAMVESLSPLGLEIGELAVDERNAWRLSFLDGLELQLGSVESEKRLQRFVTVYGRLKTEPGSRMRRIDMRYTNGLAVYWDKDVQGRSAEPVKPAAGQKSERDVTTGRGQV